MARGGQAGRSRWGATSRASLAAAVLLAAVGAGVRCPAAIRAAPAAGAPAPWDPADWERPRLPTSGPAGPAPAFAADDPARAYDVLDYRLELALDVGARRVRGAVTIALRADGAALAQVGLDLHPDLAVDTVLWDGAPAGFARDGAALLVTLPATLAADDSGALRVAYAGAPPQGVPPFGAGLMFRRHGDETSDPDDDGPIVANVSEPDVAHTWWPCKDDPADKATATIVLTYPDSLAAVSNGALVGETAPAPGLRRAVWRERYPVATYLVSVAVSNYTRWDETCACSAGALPLSFHVFPQDEARARVDLAPTCDMLRFLEGLAGPYPFAGEKYAQAEIRWGGAMENQTATSIGQIAFGGDGRHASAIVHELSHQWFGDLVTPRLWSDIWLNEGFARYVEALWIEHVQGRAAYLAELQRIGPQRHPDLFTGAGVLTDPEPVLPNLLVYDKGAWVLHMLRGQVGDAAFFRFLRAWAGDPVHAYGNATTDDLVAAASAAAGADLAPRLRPWLETAAVPELAWTAAAVTGPGRHTRVTLRVAQRQEPLFPLDLPVRVRSDTGDHDFRARLSGRTGAFTFTVDGRVADATVDVALDPDGWLLWRRADGPVVLPAVALAPAVPNPVRTGGTTLSFALSEPGRVTVSLLDARGRRLGTWELGERPAAASAWTWDGTDASGRPVPSGAYWLDVASPAGRAAARVTIVH